jgi:threonine dehydrogenase-like Zn-dependent dehydrogenase
MASAVPPTGSTDMMQAALLEKPGHFGIVDRPQPSPGWGEILVRTSVCGICTSEVDMFEGHNASLEYPRFIGHEVSGTVAGVGEGVDGFAEGDRVALYAEGRGYAEYVTVPAAWAVKMKESTPFDLALGEPIACSVNGVRKARPELGDSVAIVGCGFMGLIMMQVFRARGVGDIIAIDRRDSVLQLAEVLGATHLVNTSAAGDAVSAVKDITGGRGVDIGVESGGSQATLDLTSQIVRMEGKLEVFGFHQGSTRSVDWGWWNWMAFEIINGHTRNPAVYVEGVRIGIGMLEQGTLDMQSLVTHRFSLNEINEGFRTAIAKPEGFVKGVIAFEN